MALCITYECYVIRKYQVNLYLMELFLDRESLKGPCLVNEPCREGLLWWLFLSNKKPLWHYIVESIHGTVHYVWILDVMQVICGELVSEESLVYNIIDRSGYDIVGSTSEVHMAQCAAFECYVLFMSEVNLYLMTFSFIIIHRSGHDIVGCTHGVLPVNVRYCTSIKWVCVWRNWFVTGDICFPLKSINSIKPQIPICCFNDYA